MPAAGPLLLVLAVLATSSATSQIQVLLPLGQEAPSPTDTSADGNTQTQEVSVDIPGQLSRLLVNANERFIGDGSDVNPLPAMASDSMTPFRPWPWSPGRGPGRLAKADPKPEESEKGTLLSALRSAKPFSTTSRVPSLSYNGGVSFESAPMFRPAEVGSGAVEGSSSGDVLRETPYVRGPWQCTTWSCKA